MCRLAPSKTIREAERVTAWAKATPTIPSANPVIAANSTRPCIARIASRSSHGIHRLSPFVASSADDVVTVGQKKALADHIGLVIPETINGLEADVGHPDVVGVGVTDRHAELSRVGLEDRPDLTLKQLSIPLLQSLIHTNY